MRGIVYRNIIEVLATKLTNDNIRLRDHELQKGRLEGRLAVVEQQLREAEGRLRLAVELAAAASGRPAEEVDQQLREKTLQAVPRILVVDDEPEFRSLVRRALPAFEVLEAEDGVKALEVAAAQSVDVVLTDLRMPLMDGRALLAELRQRFPGVPVLGVSGFQDSDAVQEFGFDAFIEKPVDLQRLQELVQSAVARS